MDLFYALSFQFTLKIKSIVSTVKHLASSWWYITFHYYAKTLPSELIPDLKANLNEHPFIYHPVQNWIRLKNLYFYGKWQNHFTHTNLFHFQHLLSAEILFEWKIEFILATMFSGKFPNQCKEQTSSKVSHCPIIQRPHLDYDS